MIGIHSTNLYESNQFNFYLQEVQPEAAPELYEPHGVGAEPHGAHPVVCDGVPQGPQGMVVP
jgi:hypothetical protein